MEVAKELEMKLYDLQWMYKEEVVVVVVVEALRMQLLRLQTGEGQWLITDFDPLNRFFFPR